MSKSRTTEDDEAWADNPLAQLPPDEEDMRAWSRVQGFIGRREFTRGERPGRRTPLLGRLAAAAAIVLVLGAFAVFNLQRLGSKQTPAIPSVSASPSISASTSPSPSTQPTPSPIPSPQVATPLPVAAPPAGSWQTLAPMATPRENFTATVLQNGKVLIVGGQKVATAYGGQATADVELFDPATNQFSAAASLSIARAGHTATLLSDGRVLVAGGYTAAGNQALASAEIYDPASGTWTTAAPMSFGRTDHAAALLPDGRVVVVGGAASTPLGISPGGAHAATRPAEIFNPVSNSWTTGALPTFDRPVHPTATVLRNGTVLVVGGQYMWNSPDENAERSELYDPQSDTWSAVPPDTQSGAREFQSATLLADGRVLVAGGMHDLTPIGSAALYDPVGNSWIELPNMSIPRCGQGAVVLSDGDILLVGSGCWDQLTDSVEEYSPAGFRFFPVASLPYPQAFVVAVPVGGNRVLALGESTLGSPSGSAELFIAG